MSNGPYSAPRCFFQINRPERSTAAIWPVAVISQPGPHGLACGQLVSLPDVGKHPVELLAAALAARGLVLLMENALAGDRHRLGDGRVQVLGELAGRLLRTGIGDRDHIDAYI